MENSRVPRRVIFDYRAASVLFLTRSVISPRERDSKILDCSASAVLPYIEEMDSVSNDRGNELAGRARFAGTRPGVEAVCRSVTLLLLLACYRLSRANGTRNLLARNFRRIRMREKRRL